MTTWARPASGPLVSIIVPVRDDAERLRRCLASIRANDYAGSVEIIVLDNGSRDHSVEVAREAGARVLLVPGARVAALRNTGAQHAAGSILAFIDADHAINSRWISAAAEGITQDGVAAVGAPYLPPPNANWVQRAYDRLRPHRRGVCEVEWLGSGNLAVRTNAFMEVGGFDTSLEACEDVDLCNRLRAARHRIVSDERMYSIHFGDPSTLRALFVGELWRGRGNLRTTLRGPLTPHSLPSLVIPVLNLMFLATIVCGAVMAPWLGPRIAVYGALPVVLLSVGRAARMTFGAGRFALRDLRANFAIALVYDVARALALVFRTTHGLRRSAGM
jgi:glycosyltransferase involved in cell wall biosynthesis